RGGWSFGRFVLPLGFQCRRTLDDLRQRRARRSTLSRSACQPDGWRVLRENVLEVAVALHAARRELRDVEIARPLVAMLDQQPASPFTAAPRSRESAARTNEHPRSLQLVAVQSELEISLCERRIDIVFLRRPRSAIPQHDDARAVPLRDDPLELAVIERMIFDVHGQPFGLGIKRRPFRHGPREKHAFVLEAEVVMELRGEMLLDAEEQLARLFPGLRDRAGRLGCFLEVALPPIFLEGHPAIVPLRALRLARGVSFA